MNGVAAKIQSAWRTDHHIKALKSKAHSNPQPGGQRPAMADPRRPCTTATRFIGARAARQFSALGKGLRMKGLLNSGRNVTEACARQAAFVDPLIPRFPE